MAEFVLGRIKFVYRGAWVTGTAYVVDDVVTVGGKTYICISNNTASSLFTTDYNVNPNISKWQIVSDGQLWRGDWTASTSYNIGDLVKYGGLVYNCKTPHTSATYTNPTFLGLEQDQSKWDVFATSFEWKGTWSTTTRYKVNDIVAYGGITYVCTIKHISATTTADGLEDDLGNWQQFNAGISFLGDWQGDTPGPAVRYKENDVVKYGANLWICNTYHTSATDFDNSKWDIFVNGFEFENSWTGGETYQIGDTVTYGGYSYICKQNHSTTQIPSTATAYWEPFTTGFSFQGDWAYNTVGGYKIGSIVRNHGYTYLSVIDAPTITSTVTGTYISTHPTDANIILANTTGFVAGMGIVFASNIAGLTAGTTYYVISSGLTSTKFRVSATVGGSAVALTATTTSQSISITVSPPVTNLTYWDKLNSGIQWTDNPQTYSAVTTTNVTVSNVLATGAQYTVVRSGTTYSLTRTGNGSNYTTGDIVKILGSNVGGLSPINDITITLTASAGAVTGQSYLGISSNWKSGILYVLGDVAFFGANSYICIQTHTAASGNRPDADSTGAYWNILAAGDEAAGLTTAGDMVYFGQNGPTRLPIGTDGQILRVTNGLPSWKNYGLIQNLVYVGPTGVDVPYPDAGFSIDRPWKTVRYACQQVEAGYLNPQTQSLIVRNKQFIMKEVNNFLVYTYKVSTTGTSSGGFLTTSTAGLSINMPIRFTGTNGGVNTSTTYYVKTIVANTSFTISTVPGGTAFGATGAGANTGNFYYDQTKAERDAGIIIDAMVFDVGHGGTQKTTEATLAYFDSTGSNYITDGTGYQITQFIASVSYLSTLVGNVLANTAPSNNYQSLNGVSVVASQIIDTTTVPESGSTATAQGLVAIVTNALTAGTTAGTPAKINANNTISVKTGTYSEILPINVPSNTAIVGDELRSTVIQPMSANKALSTVLPKNQAAFRHIKTLIPDLIANNAITPTSGNTQSQITTLPAGSVGSTVAVDRLTDSFGIVYTLVSSGLSSEPVIVNPSPTGWGTTLTNTAYGTITGVSNSAGSTAGYDVGVNSIRANFGFLIADTLQHIVNNNNAVWLAMGVEGQTKGYRDVEYILDSIIWDLTYGGNKQSLVAGSSYWSFFARNITASQVTPFVDALGRLKTIITNVAQKATQTSLSGNIYAGASYSGVSGTGVAAAGAFAADRVQEVIDWINNGYGSAGVAPYTGWATSALQASFSELTSKVSEIQSDAQVWCQKYFQDVVFDLALTSRDAGLIINQLAYDMVFGSNFGAIQCGRAFCRATTSAIALRTTAEVNPTLGAINFMLYKAKQIAAAGATAQILITIDDIIDDIDGGVEPNSITWPVPALPTGITYSAVAASVVSGGGDGSATFNITRITNGNGYYNFAVAVAAGGASYTTSSKLKVLGSAIGGSTPANDIVLNVTQVSTGAVQIATVSSAEDAISLLEANRDFVLAEVVAYINVNYSSIVTNPNYSVAKTQRDAGFILDAVHYDLLYGGNWASQNAGMAYHSALYGNQISVPLQTATSATINYISTLLQSIVVGTAIGSPAQVTVLQVLQTANGVTGAAEDATQVAALVTIVKNFVDNGLTTGAPTITVTAVATNNTFTSNGHGLNNGDIVIPQTTPTSGQGGFGLSSLIIGSRVQYYVVSASTNTFKLALSYSGTAIDTFTNGTGLSLALQKIAMPYLGHVDATTIAAYTAVSAASVTSQSTSTNLSNVTITGVGGQFSCTATSLSVGNTVTISGVPSGTGSVVGYVNPTTYYILSTNGSTTFTLTATVGGTMPITTTVGTPAGLIYTLTSSGNYQSLIVTFINSTYPALVYNQSYTQRDVFNNILASMLDMCLGSNFGAIQAGRAYNRSQNYKVLGYEKIATIESLKYLQRLVSSTLSSSIYSTQLNKASATLYLTIELLDKGFGKAPQVNGTITYNNNLGIAKGAEILRANIPFLTSEVVAYYAVNYGGTIASNGIAQSGNLITTTSAHKFIVNDPVVFAGTSAGGITVGTTYYVASVPSTTTFTITTIEGYVNSNTGSTGTVVYLTDVVSPTMTVALKYDNDQTENDLTYFLNSIIWDLAYTGNYRSLRSSKVLQNSVKGSQLSDMWLVRNACGIRNMTMTGLSGLLTNVNAYGTKRPTAGSYTSLDPGFGPNDSNAWVSSRSTYLQNCSLFGSGCTGAKIDGALHAGGNRSMVLNDYTTFLSDGIGVWVTGSQSLTELVSVFSYYGYAGYLAELGAKIRATNGNSSYGTYGVIAEGVDTYETPLYANLNNRGAQAFITNTLTDGINQVLRLEYENAGSNYTNAQITISGAGVNASVVEDEFRDYGVFQTRLIDLDDGFGFGGSNYLTSANAAQSSDVGFIKIAAADQQLASAYVGMRVMVTAGTGSGQSAGILYYENGGKIAKIFKESFTSLTVTATATTNNLISVASTSSLYVGMPIYLNTGVNSIAGISGTGGATGLSTNTLYYIIAANFSSTQFAVSLELGGAAVTISNNVSALSVSLYAAGWDHVILGKTVVDALDNSTSYIIEPRISYTAPGYTPTARTLATPATWKSVTYGDGLFVAIPTGSAATTYSTNGTTWGSAGNLTSSTTWADIAFGGGQGATATAVVGGLGGLGAVLTAVLGSGTTAGQVISVTVVSGGSGYSTPPTIEFSGTGGAIAEAIILNGAITQVTVVINGSGYGTTPPTVTVRTDIVTDIIVNSWGRSYTSPPTVTISGGGSSNQATGTASLTNGGVSSIAVGNAGGTGYTSTPTVTIIDGNAKFIAIPTTASGGTTKATYTTASGALAANAWSTPTAAMQNGTYASITYGGGYWVTVGGTSTSSRTADGDNWNTAGDLTVGGSNTTSGTWSKVVYAAGYFIAITTGDSVTAYSDTSASSWTKGGALPSSASWSGLAYGNGRLVAVAGSSNKAAYSLDFGATWIASPAGLPASASWTSVTYGQGLFLAVASGTNVAATSPDGVTWTSRVVSSSSNWISAAFGNPGSNPIFTAISTTSGQIACSVRTGATSRARARVVSNAISEIRMIDPGSGYPRGTVTATTDSTNVITTTDTTNLIDSQPIEFTGCTSGGLSESVTYYVIGSTIVTNTSFKVSATAGSATAVTLTTTTGLAGTYQAGPILTQVDPNKIRTAPTRVRTGVGALGNPSFSNRGTGNTTATSSATGDGFADLYQASNFINVSNLYDIPKAGANVEFASLPGVYYKLVSVLNQLGSAGSYTATFQINPALSVLAAPAHNNLITTRLKYSQVRLTGHDFLYIGTGNFSSTNYPFVNISTAVTADQALATNGGRVFFTSTDQDGNFNVGNLFGVQQSTGTATLNASAFNLSGLQSLQLGTVSVGAGSAVITSFSTDPYFTANSDSILPTQKAIKSYITAQIGGGQSSLNVNTLTAGVVRLANNTISTTNGTEIRVTAKMNFIGGIDGAPVALVYYMQR